MSNQFPNKLITLRKHFNYSQQDISEIMGVPVSEYMKWENGSKLCSMSQLLRLSKTFEVSLDELFDNTLEISFPNNDLGDSIEIPFLNNKQNTTKIPIIENFTEEILPIQDTSSYTTNLDKTMVARIISDNQMEVIEPEETIAIKKVKPIVEEEVHVKPKKINKPIFIGIGVISLVLIFALSFFLLKNPKSNKDINEIGNINRLVAANNYSMYLQNEGNIVSHGQKPDTSKFKNVIQISAKDSTLIGLNKDGTVECVGVNCEVKDWESIKQVSASKNTILGLKEDKSVMCAGSNCNNIDTWKDVSYVYAGNEGSYGISNGSILYSGSSNIGSKLQSYKNAQAIASSTNYLVILTSSGQVETIPLSNATPLLTNTWNGVVQVAVGNDYVAGLSGNGTVLFSGNEELAAKVKQWSSIKYISGYDNYIIGINNSNLMVGAGDNSFGQYENNDVSPSATSQTSTKLAKPTNTKFSEVNSSLVISWDPVANADYYQVSINVLGNYTVKTQTNSLTIDSGKLLSNTEYMVSIVANANDTTKFETGDPLVVNYRYIGATPTPKATQYKVTFYDFDGKVILSEQTIDEGGTAVPPANPSREGYTFVGWKGAYDNVKKDTVVYANYEKNKAKTYTINFYDIGGTVSLGSLTVEENSTITPPNTPNKNNAKQSGWDPVFDPIAKKNVTYTAVYACTISYDDGTVATVKPDGTCACNPGYTQNGNKCVITPTASPTSTPPTP